MGTCEARQRLACPCKTELEKPRLLARVSNRRASSQAGKYNKHENLLGHWTTVQVRRVTTL